MNRKVLVSALVVVSLGFASSAMAAYESFTLSPGFLPDPATGSGTSGGPVDASQHGSTPNGPCVGQIDSSADHVMTLTAAFNYLRITAMSDGDVSLVVKMPDGSFRCNDDTIGLNPVVEATSWPAGRYEIYVGTVMGGNVPYQLSITEIRSSGSAAGATAQAGGDYANISIAPGFMPDPRVLTGLSGGPRDAAQFQSVGPEPCVGQIDNTPDHVVTLERDFSFLRMTVVEAAGDTTLAVQGPNGWYCNDDTIGLNPELTGSFPAGTYNVYVGSFGGGNHRYELHVTEFTRR